MKARERLPSYLSQEQIGAFFAAVSDPRDRVLFALAYAYGLRGASGRFFGTWCRSCGSISKAVEIATPHRTASSPVADLRWSGSAGVRDPSL